MGEGYKARKMDDANIEAIAKEIGLDMGKFKSDKDGEDCKKLHRRTTRPSCRSSTSTRRRRSSSTAPHVGGALPKEASSR